jgi:hypothetical protein
MLPSRYTIEWEYNNFKRYYWCKAFLRDIPDVLKGNLTMLEQNLFQSNIYDTTLIARTEFVISGPMKGVTFQRFCNTTDISLVGSSTR